MGSYSFKSVGNLKTQNIANVIATTLMPIGIRTPLSLSDTDGILSMHYTLAEQVSDNLRNLLLTNWGERLCIYHLGANLRPLLSDYTTQDDFDASAISRINSAVARWMPYINLQDYVSDVINNESRGIGSVRLTITYDVPALKITKQALQLTLKVL